MGPEFDDSNDGSGNGPAGQTEDIDNTSYYEEMDYSEPEDMEGGEPDRKNNNNNERTDDRRSVGEWLKEKLTISNIYKAFSFPFVFVAHLIHDIGRAIIFGDSLGSKPINLVNQAEKESKAEDIKKKLNEKSTAEREKEELQEDVPEKEKMDPNKESDEQVQGKEKRESVDSLNSACMRLFGQSPNSFNISNELGIEMNTDGRSKDGHKILTIGDDKIPVTQQNIRNIEKKIFESVYKNDKYVHSDKQVNVEIESKGSVITTKLSPSEQTQAYISAAVKSCIVGCAFKLSLAEEPNPKSPYCHLYLGRDKDGNTVSMSSVYDKENGTISFRIEEGELSHEVGKIPAESIIHGDQKENLGSYAFGVCEGVYDCQMEVPNKRDKIVGFQCGYPNAADVVGVLYSNGEFCYEGENVRVTKETFKDCTDLQVCADMSGSEKITIIDSMYENCQKLASCTLKDGIVSMRSTFLGCINLKQISDFPSTVKYMENTFSGDVSLNNFAYTIPDTVKTLTGCFSNCQVLSGEIYIDCNVDQFEEMFLGACEATKVNLLGNSMLLDAYANTNDTDNVYVNSIRPNSKINSYNDIFQ